MNGVMISLLLSWSNPLLTRQMMKKSPIILALIAATALMSTVIFLSAFAFPSGSYNSIYFQITNMSIERHIHQDSGSSYLAIVGFLRNIGNETYNSIRLVAALFDKNNTLIDVGEGLPSGIDAYTPRGIAPFKIPVSTPPDKLHHYVIEVTAGP
jgi:hypothetical protein